MFISSRARSPQARALIALALLAAASSTFVIDADLAGAAPVEAPAVVTIEALPGEPGILVSWPPVSGPVDTYGIDLYVDDAHVIGFHCGRTCTERAVRHLTPGQTVHATVYASHDGIASTHTRSTQAVVVQNPCASGVQTCITIDGSRTVGPVTHVAQGFLHGNIPDLDMARARALNPQSWRVRAVGRDYRSFDAARALTDEVILLISDQVPYRPDAPNGLDDYRRAVRDYVRTVIADGRVPDLWEVQNEPDATGMTTDKLLAQWDIAYEEIMAADPDARIIGLSPSFFMPTSDFMLPTAVPLETFLDHVQAKGQRIAAIGWHENAILTYWDVKLQPDAIVDHVAWGREILAARGMSDVELRIDEFSGRADGLIPGWQVGYMRALEEAAVDGAQHSCFRFTHLLSQHEGCETRSLDNALAPDDQAPRANYWVELAYGRLEGERLVTGGSQSSVSTLAARDANGVVTALVGRHVSCLPLVNDVCPKLSLRAPAATDVLARVSVPTSVAAMRIVAHRIAFSSGSVTAPQAILDTVTGVADGAVAFTIPALADGDAVILTMRPTDPPAVTGASSGTNVVASITAALRKLLG